MKHIKRIICFLLLIVTMSVFVACSDSETPPPVTDPPPVEDNNGQNGGQDSNNEENSNEDNNKDDSENQEVYVPYSSNEIMVVGSTFVSDFFNNFQVDSTDEDLFDDNIGEMKNLFLNTSKMIKEISEIENLPYGYCVQGKVVVLDEYEGKPNKVERFYAKFTSEDSDGNSNVKLRIAFSYNELSYSYSYVYYDILIETNKKQNTVSCEIGVEWSSIKDTADSTGKYYNISLSGEIGGGKNCANYNCCQFDRTNNNFEKVDYNNVDNLRQSKYSGTTRLYYGEECEEPAFDSELLLRNSNSEQSILVSEIVGELNQGYNMLFRGSPLATISGLSEDLIVYVNVQNKII